VRAGDGAGLLAHLLAQLGLAPDELTSTAAEWRELENRDRLLTWGELANPSPELARLLRRATKDGR
jgi:hypothetical protein